MSPLIDAVHSRSVQSDYALALTLAAMQRTSRIRLVLMSTTGSMSWLKGFHFVKEYHFLEKRNETRNSRLLLNMGSGTGKKPQNKTLQKQRLLRLGAFVTA